MDYTEFSAKTVDDAITEACKTLSVTSDRLEYEVVEEGSNGFLGLHAKNAVIKAKIKDSLQDKVSTFLYDVSFSIRWENRCFGSESNWVLYWYICFPSGNKRACQEK